MSFLMNNLILIIGISFFLYYIFIFVDEKILPLSSRPDDDNLMECYIELLRIKMKQNE